MRLGVVPIALVAALLHASSEAGAATQLVGRLESADNCQVANVTLTIDKGDTCVTTDSGAFVCGAPGLPGEEVRLILTRHPKCLIFYPPDGRTTLKRPEARESVSVTLVERDSPRWKSTDELRALLRASGIRRDSQALTPQQLDERLKSWASAMREAMGHEAAAPGAEGRNDEAFVRLLVAKQGQIQEFTRVSEVFHRFLNNGRELVAVFRRHAGEVPEIAGAAQYLVHQLQLSSQAFEELTVRGDSYQAIVLSYWGAEAAAGYSRLLEETLTVHRDGLYKVNDLNALINRLALGKPKADEKRRLKQELAERNAAWAADCDARLVTLTRQVDAYLAELKASLADF
jgi:hypothetical protein